MKNYNHTEIESKWQKNWENNRTFRTLGPGDKDFDPKQPKFYVLDMFPYPSGSGLHVGHAVGYIGSDIIARKKRMEGFNVLHPMGWDAFGLPAEQYAIQTGQHPSQTTTINAENFRSQLKLIGLSYDWDREINTSDPTYYKWTQWLFLKLFEKGLVYEKEESVWWCEDLKTVLANEEVISGRSERGNYPCVRRPLKQWIIKITAYADRLIQDLDLLDWPESVKKMQLEWIGKSEGVEIQFQIDGMKDHIKIYTTRPETIYGATAIVLAPEHPLAIQFSKNDPELSKYLSQAAARSERDRQSDVHEVTGAPTKRFAINPLIPESDPRRLIPIYVGDYVLSGYGTGAVMSVPGHDERDHKFAKIFNLPIIQVIKSPEFTQKIENECYTGDGLLLNSYAFDDMSVQEGRIAIAKHIEKSKLGLKTTKYRLRDWLFSRQRYWGEPFPLSYTQDDKVLPVSEKNLPVILPNMTDFTPSADGSAPLARVKDWVHYQDPATGEKLRRVTDTMPGWAGSCWYYLRFMDPKNPNECFSKEAVDYWNQVDLYIGGTSHAVMHLLYARFWHKVLFDCGLVSYPEPFKRLFNQGMITAFAFKDSTGRLVQSDLAERKGEQWIQKSTGEPLQRFVTKMSKSLKNVTNPDDVIREHGADTLRLYEMFMGPLSDEKPWTDEGISGCRKFVQRLWNLILDENGEVRNYLLEDTHESKFTDETITIERALNRCLVRINDSFQNLNFNTSIAAAMEFINTAIKLQESMNRSQVERFILMLSPFMPHLCEELWERLGKSNSLAREKWPDVNSKYLESDTFELVIQHNGKVRKRVTVEKTLSGEEIKKIAFVQLNLDASAISTARVIVVPGRLINIVTK